MSTEITIMVPGQPTEKRVVDLPAEPSYEQIKEVVQPIIGADRWFERVAVLVGESVLDMFVDEMGHVEEPPLPRNEEATAHYRNATIAGRTPVHFNGDPESIPCIVGPAVLFSRRVWF